MKRWLDLFLALFGLLFLMPVFLGVALLIRLNMGSPVLFRQHRPGLHGQVFPMFKFRTMKNAVNEQGDLLPDAERLTRLGLFLRKYSLDELPELFNVLRGEMSLVGPRPLLVDYLPLYSPEQARRHDVKPGLTGWAQINGRNTLRWEDKFKCDVWYVDHQSIWLDFKIIFLTLFKVLKKEGVSQEGHVTMEKFRGNQSC